MNRASAPAARYSRARSRAASRPSTARASVLAMIMNSGWALASAAARIFCAISSAGMTCLPSMCPHFFGATWSSMCTAATPAASYAWIVRITFSGLP